MGRLDLSAAQELRVAGQPVSRVRHLGQDVYVGPYTNDFEDGSMPFTVPKSSAGIVPVNTDLSAVRSGTRSVRFGQESASHGARVDGALQWRRWDVAETWLLLMPQTEANPAQARLGGITVEDRDSGSYWTCSLDSRNGTGSNAPMQIRTGVDLGGAWAGSTSERIVHQTWYRLRVWVEPTRLAMQVFNEAGTLIGGTARVMDGLPTRIQFGIYSYGWTVFDDYCVSPGVRAV